MIFWINTLFSVVGGVYIFYICSLWILCFFNKRKLVAKLSGDDDSLYYLSAYNLFLIICLSVDIYHPPKIDQYAALAAILMSTIGLIGSIIIIGLICMIVSEIRSSFIDT